MGELEGSAALAEEEVMRRILEEADQAQRGGGGPGEDEADGEVSEGEVAAFGEGEDNDRSG